MKASFKKIVVISALVLGLAVVITATIFVFKRPHAQPPVTPPTPQSGDNSLLTNLAKLTELPTNEIPTIATVDDPNKIRGQTFFLYAKNGDKILVYPLAKRAILYRPSTNKVIEITTISVNIATPSASVTP